MNKAFEGKTTVLVGTAYTWHVAADDKLTLCGNSLLDKQAQTRSYNTSTGEEPEKVGIMR